MSESHQQTSGIRSILVRSPNWIGDQVLAYPFFHYLRKFYPDARIAAACVPWVQSVQFRDLIDDVITLEKPKGEGPLARIRALEGAARKIRAAGPWDLGICLPNSFSAAWIFYRAGVPLRRGYNTDARGFLLHQKVRWPRQVAHRAQAYVDLLPAPARPARPVSEFWGLPAGNELDEDLPGELSRFDAARAWPDAEPIPPPKGPYWVLAPGATAESRRWPVRNYAALARMIAERMRLPGLVVGGFAEARIAESLCEDKSLYLVDMTGQGPPTSFWKVFESARFTVCNDSGLAHLASLCGSQVQVVWGAGNLNRTRPIGPGKVRVVFNPLECWPCERNTCSRPPGHQFECIRGVAAETVWEELHAGVRR